MLPTTISKCTIRDGLVSYKRDRIRIAVAKMIADESKSMVSHSRITLIPHSCLRFGDHVSYFAMAPIDHIAFIHHTVLKQLAVRLELCEGKD